jgi:transglutaminase-like putative cysteine protease
VTYTDATWFRHICRLILFCFIFTTFHPTSLRVPWTLHFAHWTFDFGPPPAYGQAADLAPTPDADSTDPFIVQKAQELGNNAAQIFAFVRDEIGYESYKGSLRGARGTLWSKAGNALDQASLLIALLRASNIPARYVQGTLPNNLARN